MSKLEGDAIFLYALKDRDDSRWKSFRETGCEKLLRFFTVFHDRRAELGSQGGCACGACTNISALRLKMVAHSGKAFFYHLHEFEELSGGDVILVHRLLKNSVGDEEYLLMIESACEDLMMPSQMLVGEGIEKYKHLGQIRTFLYLPESALKGTEGIE